MTYTIHSGLGQFTASSRIEAIDKACDLRTCTWATVQDNRGHWVMTNDGQMW